MAKIMYKATTLISQNANVAIYMVIISSTLSIFFTKIKQFECCMIYKPSYLRQIINYIFPCDAVVVLWPDFILLQNHF